MQKFQDHIARIPTFRKVKEKVLKNINHLKEKENIRTFKNLVTDTPNSPFLVTNSKSYFHTLLVLDSYF